MRLAQTALMLLVLLALGLALVQTLEGPAERRERWPEPLLGYLPLDADLVVVWQPYALPTLPPVLLAQLPPPVAARLSTPLGRLQALSWKDGRMEEVVYAAQSPGPQFRAAAPGCWVTGPGEFRERQAFSPRQGLYLSGMGVEGSFEETDRGVEGTAVRLESTGPDRDLPLPTGLLESLGADVDDAAVERAQGDGPEKVRPLLRAGGGRMAWAQGSGWQLLGFEGEGMGDALDEVFPPQLRPLGAVFGADDYAVERQGKRLWLLMGAGTERLEALTRAQPKLKCPFGGKASRIATHRTGGERPAPWSGPPGRLWYRVSHEQGRQIWDFLYAQDKGPRRDQGM